MEENNKIIAEFMKIDVSFDGRFSINPMTRYGCWEIMKYHSDWNWLMEVVEKIESKCNNLGFQISAKFVHIRVNNNLTISSGVKSNRINAVYSACIEFIKSYNKREEK